MKEMNMDMTEVPTCLPSIEDLMKDPSVSSWLKSALQANLARDPVDAANDAELLALVLDKRAQACAMGM